MERLLVGETPAIDLVNTRWIAKGEIVDFLAAEGATELWLREYGFDPAREDTDALLRTRDALQRFLESPGALADEAVNTILDHGHTRMRVVDGQRETEVIVDTGWGAAFSTTCELLELLAVSPERVRQCAHPDCVLFFYDTSRNGRRRWHSMETCGARTKSARHYERTTSA